MLRRLLWIAMAAGATMLARMGATKLYSLITGEPPPGKKK
jgi:hypothetical protein